MILETQQWAYLYTKPQAKGLIKQQPEDFIVRETLGFEPCGEGEHIFVWLRKCGLNTAYVAEQLARFAGVHPRAVTFSGRKDKYAVTEQWFGVHLPGKREPQWDDFALPGATIIESKRHNKKLRTGIHKGNQFELVLRDLTNTDTLEQRLTKVGQGVPNYFGPQRFGTNNGNLHLGLRMLQGETIRNRQKRSMAISALRAWLFNQTLSERIRLGCFDKILAGDIMVLSGSNSYFCAGSADKELLHRLASRDILLSAPLWGQGLPDSQAEALTFEQQIATEYELVSKGLEDLGLKQDRRPIRLSPQNLDWQLTEDTLKLTFSLPPGGFATAVVRELLIAEEQIKGAEHANSTEQ
ncbi:tRNA pseudouridine(13) synthase TruD [Lacimicrobium alkaliphilum]|uniref:tRNA pseudouridine synthase D n=1 Tax=Lacimicrobium alkaliphilum TaxID=1526571 RepID=A0ABQ1QXD9_9ALTE|nr:tRNA pseudouridine(13) synthase TruD [Lacimicrobium alkaliphilum]GGD49905.1 tRNA pseudouridine synthase D [Lacimicrobium alkaliphilum]